MDHNQWNEFQAVVLAGGKGSRMMDLTSSKPKCLLPIGNYPMIWYSLNMLQKIGFREVIVVVQESWKSDIASLPHKFDLSVSLDIVAFPNSEDLGTADAIRLVNDKIHSERVMIVSSDLITDLQIHNLTDLHRVHRASVTALFTPMNIDPKQIPVPGPKSKFKREKDLVGIDEANNQLCFLSSEADLDEFVSLKRTMLLEHSRISIKTNLLDAHFYIFEKWVCDFISFDESITVIKGELLPFLVKKQFSRRSKTEADGESPPVKRVGDQDRRGKMELIIEYSTRFFFSQVERTARSYWSLVLSDLSVCLSVSPS